MTCFLCGHDAALVVRSFHEWQAGVRQRTRATLPLCRSCGGFVALNIHPELTEAWVGDCGAELEGAILDATDDDDTLDLGLLPAVEARPDATDAFDVGDVPATYPSVPAALEVNA